MMPFVITLTGASQCGKSKIIEILHKMGEDNSFRDFLPISFQKFTTRAFRDYEIKAIKNGRADTLDLRPVLGDYNNNDALDAETLKIKKMQAFQNLKCDLAYEQFGDRYGLRLSDLYDLLKQGKTPIVILNDVRTVEDIKTKLGGQCFSIFIYRESPDRSHFFDEGIRRGESPATTDVRFQKATAIYRIYIENIHIFDKLILNVKEDTDSLKRILHQLIKYLCNPVTKFR